MSSCVPYLPPNGTPSQYMDDTFSHEYDAYLDAWVETALTEGSLLTPGGRRDHTLEIVGERIIVTAGIDNSHGVLKDLWSINFSR